MDSNLLAGLTFLSYGLHLIPQYPTIITSILALVTGIVMLFGLG